MHHATLIGEITAAISKTPQGITDDENGDDVQVTFSPDDLTTQNETDLGTAIAAHTGPAEKLFFRATSMVVVEEKAITQDTTWQELGGVVSTIGAFVADLSKARGRIVGQVKTSGTAAQFRIVKENDTSLLTTAHAPGDTSGAWTALQFSTDNDPVAGIQLYRLQGRLNGATSASVRYVSMSLLEVVT